MATDIAANRQIVYPPGKDTWALRVAHLLAAQEALRRQHNARGADCLAGRITEAELSYYHYAEFAPRMDAIAEAISSLKHQPDAADLADVDLTTGFPERR